MCHTIHQSKKELRNQQKTMKTLCGKEINLERQSHGFLLNGQPVLSMAQDNRVIVLIDFVLWQP